MDVLVVILGITIITLVREVATGSGSVTIRLAGREVFHITYDNVPEEEEDTNDNV